MHIYHAHEESENAYWTCVEVLAELGETVSERFDEQNDIATMSKSCRSLDATG